MLKQCCVQHFNPKGIFDLSQKCRNPGLSRTLKPKAMHGSVAAPKRNMPFSDNQVVAPELVGSFVNRVPEIMKGMYGRVSSNRDAMQKGSFFITNKLSAYRWLKGQEQRMRANSNISAAFEEHGLAYEQFKQKQFLQGMSLTNKIVQDLAGREPLALRCIAEVMRSDNLLMYDRYPGLREERRYHQRRKEKKYGRDVMKNPLPVRARLEDPSWREIPYMAGRRNDSNFHPQHPVFTIDWKV